MGVYDDVMTKIREMNRGRVNSERGTPTAVVMRRGDCQSLRTDNQ